MVHTEHYSHYYFKDDHTLNTRCTCVYPDMETRTLPISGPDLGICNQVQLVSKTTLHDHMEQYGESFTLLYGSTASPIKILLLFHNDPHRDITLNNHGYHVTYKDKHILPNFNLYIQEDDLYLLEVTNKDYLNELKEHIDNLYLEYDRLDFVYGHLKSLIKPYIK